MGGIDNGTVTLGAEARRPEEAAAGAGLDDDILHALVLEVNHQARHVGHRRHVAIALGDGMVHLVDPFPLTQVRRINSAIADYALGGVDHLAGQEHNRYAETESSGTRQ